MSFQHEVEFIEILEAVKGSSNEKRLASQFIARFFKYFPHLIDQAIEAQLDLCEDDDVSVSINVIIPRVFFLYNIFLKFYRYVNRLLKIFLIFAKTIQSIF